MTYKEIQELVKLINKSNITEFKLEQESFKISIRTKKYGKTRVQTTPTQQIVPIAASPMPAVQPTFAPPVVSAPPPASAPAPAPNSGAGKSEAGGASAGGDNYIEVRSPIVGTFYRSASPDKPPYIKVGDVIEEGDVVCIVEAMKLFNEIESEVSGKVVKIMLDDAQPVEYDQVLFLLEPS